MAPDPPTESISAEPIRAPLMPGAPAAARVHVAGSARARYAGAAFNAALLTAMVLLAGLTPVAAKDALREMPLLTTGFLRFGIAAVLLMFTYRLRRRSDPKARVPISRFDYGHFFLAGLLCVPINQSTFLVGVQLAGASHAGLFYALNPVLVYLLTLVLGKAGWSWRMGSAALLAFAGAGTIGWEGHRLGDTGFLLGDVLLFGAVASFAAYTVVVAPLAARYGPLRTVAIVMTIGAALYSPACLVDGGQLHLFSLSWRALGGFAFITFLTSYLNYMFWGVALTRLDINRLSVGVNTAPIVAVVGAHLWHEEPITRWLTVGAALILSAITLANWDKVRALRQSRRG